MASNAVDPRIRHLHNASLALIASSPAVSAHLQAVRLSILRETGAEATTSDHEPVCTGCGSILIRSWSCSVQRSKGRRGRKIAQDENKGIKVACHACKSITILPRLKTPKGRKDNKITAKPSFTAPLPQKPAEVPHIAPESEALPSSQPAPTADTTSSSASTSRKARGKKQSLQALVAGQKRSEPTAGAGSGLNLMDFMKT
ncbi:hypothetical protein NU195Hw_Modified_84t1 [Hortaea werneckii]